MLGGAKRVFEFTAGLLAAVCAVSVLIRPEAGYYLSVILLLFSLAGKGISKICYFFTMARHMVGGWSVLYSGILYLDMGIFALGLYFVPHLFTMLYLVGVFTIIGAIDILRAIENKKINAAWKKKFAAGVIKILVAAVCMVFMNSAEVFSAVFSVFLVITAADCFMKAFQKETVVYEVM